MSNIIKTLENQKIINKENPIKNKAFEILLDFDMPDNVISVFNNSLYFSSNDEEQVLIEVKDKEIREIDVIKGNDKYMIINHENDETIGIDHEKCGSIPFFTAHYCSLKNEISTKYYDYLYIISGNKNVIEFNKKEKDRVKVLVK